MYQKNLQSVGRTNLQHPVSALRAVQHDKLGTVTPVWNLNEINYYIWVEVPHEVCSHTRVYEVAEINPITSLPEQVDVNAFERCSGKWLRIVSGVLNMHSGKHVYRIGCVDTITGDTFYLFVSYIVQNDNPDKPYIYMDNVPGSTADKGGSGTEDEQWIDWR